METADLQKLVIYGLSSPLVFKLLDAINRKHPVFNLQGIVRSRGDNLEMKTYGYPLLGDATVIEEWAMRPGIKFFCNINRSPREMKEADDLLHRHGCRTVSLVHPGIDLSYVTLGRNVCLAEGCLVGPEVVIGNHVTCRLGCIVSHEVVLEDRVYMGPGAKVCGVARLLEGADIGAGATILPKVTVGRNTIVGAGAVVTNDLPDHVTAVGVPARIIKRHEPDDERFF